MKLIVAILGAVALLAAPTASAGTGFTDKKAFENYVAGYLHVRSVSCQKLNARVVDCMGSDRRRVVVACRTATGKNCLIARY